LSVVAFRLGKPATVVCCARLPSLLVAILKRRFRTRVENRTLLHIARYRAGLPDWAHMLRLLLLLIILLLILPILMLKLRCRVGAGRLSITPLVVTTIVAPRLTLSIHVPSMLVDLGGVLNGQVRLRLRLRRRPVVIPA